METAKDRAEPVRLFTVGHSNRSFEDFHALLVPYQVRVIADIRRFPSSRKFTHFNQKALQALLEGVGIRYAWFESLGGLRPGRPDQRSPNLGLNSPAFRNYADHMRTQPFQEAVRALLALAGRERTAIMCAERFFWKCHRRLLSDFLLVHGASVDHILDRDSLRSHTLTPGVIVKHGGEIIYTKASGDA